LERWAFNFSINHLPFQLKDEDSMTPEERAEKKQKEIQEEFLRYKLARKIQEKRAPDQGDEDRDDEGKSKLDVEIKMAGKAREKFREIEAHGAQAVPLPGKVRSLLESFNRQLFQSEQKASKWDKKEESTAEVVNRRTAQGIIVF
jgi:hypothetical protein